MPKTTPQISKLIVHDGVFHADDVLCAAMAKSLNPGCMDPAYKTS